MNQRLLEQHKIYNNALFKRYVSYYDTVDIVIGGLRDRIAKELRGEQRVLDAACGTGSLSVLLAKNGASVVGADISPDMLAAAERKADTVAHVTFTLQDITQLSYTDGYFDASVISLSLHDMPGATHIPVLQELKRVTKKRGKILIADYNVGDSRNPFIMGLQRIPSVWESK